MGAPASTEWLMDIIFQLFHLEAIVPDSSSSSGNKRNVTIWFSQFVWAHFLHFSSIMPKISLNSKVFSIFSVLWNFISSTSVLCHQPMTNTSNILTPFLRYTDLGYTIMQSSLLIPFPSQNPYILSLGLWLFSRPTLNPLLTHSSWTLNVTCVLMTLRFVIFLDVSPDLQTLYPTDWHLRMYSYRASQISNSWKRRSVSTLLCSFEKGVFLVLAIATVNGTTASPNCSALTPGCHLPFLALHIPNPSNPSKWLYGNLFS